MTNRDNDLITAYIGNETPQEKDERLISYWDDVWKWYFRNGYNLSQKIKPSQMIINLFKSKDKQIAEMRQVLERCANQLQAAQKEGVKGTSIFLAEKRARDVLAKYEESQ